MRCGCPICSAYMVHCDDDKMGCVCPECSYRCMACLGTDSVLNHDELIKRAESIILDNALEKCTDD